jgi:hypothetical protein
LLRERAVAISLSGVLVGLAGRVSVAVASDRVIAQLPIERLVFGSVRRICWTIAIVAALVSLCPGLASAQTFKPERGCAVPAHWTVVGRDSKALVITGVIRVRDVDGERTPGPEQQWRYCPRKSGRSRVLVTNSGIDGGYADIYRVDHLKLSGNYVAYDSVDNLGGGRYGVDLGVDVTNVVSGKNESAEPIGDAFDSIVLAPPFAAWISITDQPDWFVQSFDGLTGNTTTLDSTCPSGACSSTTGASDPFAGLQVTRCLAGCTPVGAPFVWWTRDGIWRSAQVK